MTLDGRLFVVRGRLWRMENPALVLQDRERLVHDLMPPRPTVGDALAERAKRARELFGNPIQAD